MEKSNNLRKLVELIFIKSETALQDASIPTCLKEYDFYKKLRYVLFMRNLIIEFRWEKQIEIEYFDMLSSHLSYLAHVIHICLEELTYNFNVFDSFISVCCLVEYFSTKIFQAFGVNFCGLNSDMLMAFYDNVLKKNFSKRGGLKRFVSHICQHKYLEWKWDRNDLDSPNGPSSPVNSDAIAKLHNENDKESHYQNKFKPDLATGWSHKSISLAKRVLSTTKVQLPVMPKQHDLAQLISELKRNKMNENEKKRKCNKIVSELDNLEKLWPGCSVSNSNSTETDSSNLQSTVSKELEDFEKHEKIIQAVIRYNRSRKSSFVNLDSQILKEVVEILEFIKNKLESLIDLIDDKA